MELVNVIAENFGVGFGHETHAGVGETAAQALRLEKDELLRLQEKAALLVDQLGEGFRRPQKLI